MRLHTNVNWLSRISIYHQGYINAFNKMNNRNKIRFDIIILQLSTCIFCPSKNNSLVGKAKSERCEVVIVFVFCVEGLAPQTTGRS